MPARLHHTTNTWTTILRTTIRAADRCRALIEGVDSSKVCGRLFYKRNCRHESSSFVSCPCSRTG